MSIKTYQTVPLKTVQFNLCKLYSNKTDFKRKKHIVQSLRTQSGTRLPAL